MHLVKPLSTIISMVACISTLSIFSVLGNGFVIGIIARFKKLRTFPNILIANLALVDLLNALISMPIYLLYAVLEVSWFKGKTLAILSFCLHRLSQLLNMVSMLVLLVNVLLAVAFDLRYFTWKTNERAMAIVVFEWLFSIAVVLSTSVSLLEVDLQDAHVFYYRQQFFKEQRLFVAAASALFVVSVIVVDILTVYFVRRRKLQRKRLNLSPLQAEARLKQDIKASKTAAITVLAFLVCYIQPVLYAASGRQDNDLTNAWLAFLVTFSIFISSGINPVIYCFRQRRFRLALKQLVKDPCGRSPFQETNEGAGQNVRRQITKQTAASKKITNKHEEAAGKENEEESRKKAAASKKFTNKHEEAAGKENEGESRKKAAASKKFTNKHEEEAGKENAGESSGLGNNLKLSFHELESGKPVNIVKMAWAENGQNGCQGKSSANLEERPTTIGVNTKQEITVEIHSYHKDKGHLHKATKNEVQEKSLKERYKDKQL